MRNGPVLLAALLAVVAFVFTRRPSAPSETPKSIVTSRPEFSHICSWREPQRDLASLFPPATNYTTDMRILSGLMVPIQKRLGRMMTPDENPLRIYRATLDGDILGSVLVRRLKGEHGAIEIVTGIDRHNAVQGVLIQSHREPENVVAALTNWLTTLAGKDTNALLKLGVDLPDVPPQARASAEAIADGVRSQLLLLPFAETALRQEEPAPHDHH